jgi:hypothetical protein
MVKYNGEVKKNILDSLRITVNKSSGSSLSVLDI